MEEYKGSIPIAAFLRHQAQIKIIVNTHKIFLSEGEEIPASEMVKRISQFYTSFQKQDPEGLDLLDKWGRLLKLRRQRDQVLIILT